MSEKYDLVVIGAGSGGVRAARMSAALGARVAVVEGRFFGGTCVNVGCVPKKLFAYAADVPSRVAQAGDFGFSAQASAVDWATLRGNKDTEIARLNGIYESLLKTAGVDIYTGYGRIINAGEVQVGDQLLSTSRILIATGGQPWLPEFPGREHVLISDDLFTLPALPESAVVVGGGYIASEFASILNGLGVQVTQLYRGELFLRGFDDDIRQHVATHMRADGVDLRFNADIQCVERVGDKRRATLVSGEVLEVDQIFYAVGRVPKVDGLFDGLDIHLKVNGAIEVNERFETSVPGIYAIGDVIDRVQLTPVALAEGMWLANHLFGEPPAQPLDYSLIATAVFCHPNVATIGLTEHDAIAHCGRVRVYRSAFRPLRYAMGTAQQRTLMKLIVDDASDRVLGLHMAGDDAAEIAQGFAVAMRMGARKADFDQTIGIHPSAAEEFVTLRQGEVRPA